MFKVVKSDLNSALVKLKERRSLTNPRRRAMGSSFEEGSSLQFQKMTDLLYPKAKEHREVSRRSSYFTAV